MKSFRKKIALKEMTGFGITIKAKQATYFSNMVLLLWTFGRPANRTIAFSEEKKIFLFGILTSRELIIQYGMHLWYIYGKIEVQKKV